MELLITGRTFGPKRRFRWASSSPLFDSAEAAEQVESLARAVRRRTGAGASRRSSAACTRASQLPLEDGLALEAELIERLFRSQDALEGLTAFARSASRSSSAHDRDYDDATVLRRCLHRRRDAPSRRRADDHQPGHRRAGPPTRRRHRPAASTPPCGAAHAAFARMVAPAVRRPRRDPARLRARRSRPHVDELVPLLVAEQGKTLREARIELHQGGRHARALRRARRRRCAACTSRPRPGRRRPVLRRPLGVVGAIVPWNFPTTLLCNKLGPALLAGNTVVAKPADTTPLTTLRFAEILPRPGCRPACSTSCPARGRWPARRSSPTRSCARSPSPARRRSASRSWRWPRKGTKRVTLELGGSDPMIICDDADLDARPPARRAWAASTTAARRAWRSSASTCSTRSPTR